MPSGYAEAPLLSVTYPPLTSSLPLGLVWPIPTLPELFTRTRSAVPAEAFLVEIAKYPAALLPVPFSFLP